MTGLGEGQARQRRTKPVTLMLYKGRPMGVCFAQNEVMTHHRLPASRHRCAVSRKS